MKGNLNVVAYGCFMYEGNQIYVKILAAVTYITLPSQCDGNVM